MAENADRAVPSEALLASLTRNLQEWVEKNYTYRFSALGVVTDEDLPDVLRRIFNEVNGELTGTEARKRKNET